jgi:hypothetical protein
MASAFERSNEWGGYTIEPASTGFILHYHGYREDDVDSMKILVPYGTWGFSRTSDLDAPYDDIATNGEMLAVMALDEAKVSSEERKVEVLNQGISPRPRRATSPDSVAAGGAEKSCEGVDTSWFTFTAKKEDDFRFGEAHDLFTTMFLTHGLPRGMALWDTSKPASEENVFYVQVPKGVDLKNDTFFKVFRVSECAPPSMAGLTFLAGNPGVEAGSKAASGRVSMWRRRGAPSAMGR